MKRTRVLIVDDHALSRKGIAAILEPDPAFLVVGEAADGAEALAKVRELQPDLVLMDIRMPEMSGLEATKRIKAEHPHVIVVILSVSDDVRDFFEAIKLGAQGYLLKDLQPQEWLGYLRAVVSGETPVSSELAARLLEEFRRGDTARPVGGDISERELEVLQKVAEGLSNREIGAALHIAESTVKNHLRNILEKLHLRNRAQLVAYAYEQGWLRPGAKAEGRLRRK